MLTKQDEILWYVFHKRNKLVDVSQVIRWSRLKRNQVYSGLRSLKNRNLIVKRYEKRKAGYGQLPLVKMFVFLNPYKERWVEDYFKRKENPKEPEIQRVVEQRLETDKIFPVRRV